MSFSVVAMESIHVDGVVALQRACFPPPFPTELLWEAEQIEAHLERCPECQFVALADDVVIASASALIIGEKLYQAHRDLMETAGGFTFENHDPDGTTLYAVDISVHPDFRGYGVASALYERRFELVRDLGLTRLATACRIPDYSKWCENRPSDECGLERYVSRVTTHHLNDRTLTPLLKIGMKPKGITRNFIDDPESGNAAVRLEWTP